MIEKGLEALLVASMVSLSEKIALKVVEVIQEKIKNMKNL